jgi:tight adherence protein C
MLIPVLLFVLLFSTISIVGYFAYAKPTRFNMQLGAMLTSEQPSAPRVTAGTGQKWFVRVIQTIGEKVPISPADANQARRDLFAAGHRSERSVIFYNGTRIVLAVALFVVAVVGRAYIENPILRNLILVAGPFFGFFLPSLILDRMIIARRERIRFALPDTLDLMVVCMEAGLGLDQAIANVSRELRLTHKDISEELSLVTLEMRAGKRRVEALKNLADRAGEADLRKLVATMIQADRFGTSVAESLRTHSDFMRVKRRQEAEERAAKVGVKLVFPIFFFILPAMLAVAAGPGILAMIKHLFPMLKSAGQ